MAVPENLADKAAAPAAKEDAPAVTPEEAAVPDVPGPAMGGSRGPALLNGEIEILPGQPLPVMDRGPVKAYAARGKNDTKDSYFALVCEQHLIPRSREGPKLAAILNPGLVKLVASGIVYWPPARAQRYVFVYENTLGQPLVKPGDHSGLGWKHELVMNTVIRPMVSVLMDLRDADLVHGAINPVNMFDGGKGAALDKVILGECLCLPPSYAQPALYEPIERAMADPIARGLGTIEDDVYSFGVVLAVILRHKDPLEGMDDAEIIRQKIELGSYAALTGKERFTGSILELLRGLLYDDRAQRWTLGEVQQWLDGQRLSPKQNAKKIKAARPVHFEDERYFRPSLLAFDMVKNQPEAVTLVEGGQLTQWIERSLEDKIIGNRYEQAVTLSQEEGRGPGYWDKLLARISIALDPEAPIRYKGLSLHPEGIPYALTETFYKKGNINPFLDIINQQLVIYWLNAQYDLRVDIGALVSRYDSCRAFLRQNTVGYGVERCLYFLNRDCPCLSEKVKGYYIRNPEDLLLAFEEIAYQPNRPDLFIDRHIAAFISVKDRRDIDAYMVELNADEYYMKVIGNIKTLATIQKRSRMDMLPGIAGWMADILEPVYERFHDRELRDQLRQKVDKIKVGGDLTKIAAILDDDDLHRRDFINYRKAMQEYHDLREEHDNIEKKRARPESFAKQTGAEVAAVVSGFLACIIILAFAFLYFFQGGAF